MIEHVPVNKCAPHRDALRVADLFCGPGGLSEGFRLAGFEIVYGLDKKRDAVETFRVNHPGAVAVVGDATTLDVAGMPEFDVLIGGPPCVNFSNSKGNRANVLEGLRLVQCFLRVVHLRKPAYWVMENVPRVARHLPDQIPLRWIGIDEEGCLDIPVRHEFSTDAYGIPQRRSRFLIGNYPIPNTTHGSSDGARCPTLGDVLATLPPPHRPGARKMVKDINYGFSIPARSLTDHHHPVTLEEVETDRIREVKTQHPYMGKMAFPDRLDRPARTVVATQLGRETLVVVNEDSGKGGYRRLSVRECATLQTFPITYHFAGRTIGSRYHQAGDAVPPMFSFAIAKAILAHEGRVVPGAPLLGTPQTVPAPAAPAIRRSRSETVLPWNKRFARIVPGKEIRGCRVEFNNLNLASPSNDSNAITWQATLHVGELKGNVRKAAVTVEDALWELAGLVIWHGRAGHQGVWAFLDRLEREFSELHMTGHLLQEIYTRRTPGEGPRALTDRLSACVNAHFPASTFAKKKVSRSGRIPIVPGGGLLVRLAAAMAGAAVLAEKVANPGTTGQSLRQRLEQILRERRVADHSVEPMLVA
jgi:DNA (cytosine-5)-methyltransferase 1